MAILAIRGDTLLGTGADAPIRVAAQIVTAAIDAGALVLAVGLASHVGTILTRRLRVRRVAGAIAAAPSSAEIEAAVRSALADPTAEVGYWVDETMGFARPDGTLIVAPPGAGRTLTVMGDGNPVACIEHESIADSSSLTREVRPSMLIALDNERLRTASAVRLADLQRSRRRIVELGDAERRRLERDLHDGAQQRLMAISFDLRLARLEAEREGDAAEADRIASLEAVSARAVDELRRVARGIHPAILSEIGLGDALESLAEESPIHVTVSVRLEDPPSSEIQVTAYHLAREAIADAVARRASEVRVDVRTERGALHIAVADTGTARTEVPVRVADRAGAAGGSASIRPVSGNPGASFEAIVPCG
jgi:signal transduction histidine kinase